MTDPLRVALRVAEALETCGVRYLVGGSLASSISGEPRSTLDADLVVALAESDVEPFLAALGGEFHAESTTRRRRRSTCSFLVMRRSTRSR